MNPVTLNLNLICLYLFFALMVNIPKQDRVTRNWARVFSLGLVVMAVQIALASFQTPGSYGTDKVSNVLSSLNNIFFLGGALILLDKKNRSHNWRFLFFDPVFLTILGVTLLLIIAISLSDSKIPTSIRLASAVISGIIYLVEAWAYFTVLNFFRFNISRFLHVGNILRFLPLGTALIFFILEVANASGRESFITKTGPYLATSFRWLFFIPPVLLLLTTRIQQELDANDAVENATPKRDFVLSNGTGFVRSIGQTIKSQKVLLLIKKPGFHFNTSDSIDDRFYSYGWQEGQSSEDGIDGKKSFVDDITDKERQCLEQVCQQKKPESCKTEDGCWTLVLPFVIYGGVIGVLFVRLSKGVEIRSILTEKLSLATQSIVMLVQGSRQMAAIGTLGERFYSSLAGEGWMERAGKQEAQPNLIEGVYEILRSVFETLSPLAIALRPSSHFNSREPIILLPDKKYFDSSKRPSFEQKYFAPEPDDTSFDGMEPIRTELDYGRMIMFVGEQSDHPDRPTMGIHPNARHVLEAMVNRALKTILRRNLSLIEDSIYKQTDVGFKEQFDGNRLARILQEQAESFGISWLVMVVDRTRYFGSVEKFPYVQQHIDHTSPVRTFNYKKIALGDGKFSGTVTYSEAWQVEGDAENNGHAEHQISFWFGVDHPNFTLDAPWREFFSLFTRIGIAKIKDVLMREMASKIENDQAIMSVIHIQAVITHQFSNLLKELRSAIECLEADLARLEIQQDEKVNRNLVWLKKGYNTLWSLKDEMFKGAGQVKLNKSEFLSNERPSNVKKVIENVLDDIRLMAENGKIEITHSSDNSVSKIDTPYNVAYLGLYNLLSNSIVALAELNGCGRARKIQITLTNNQGNIFCKIKDTGPGLMGEDEPFKRGWGLNLIKAMLHDYNCGLSMVETGPDGTVFEIRFPIYRQE